jgi:hypothetical protein
MPDIILPSDGDDFITVKLMAPEWRYYEECAHKAGLSLEEYVLQRAIVDRSLKTCTTEPQGWPSPKAR